MTPIRTLCWVLCLCLAFPFPVLAPAAHAIDTGFSVAPPGGGAGSEYVSGNFPGAVLMPVNLWGAVGRPGIHHIPTRTDLVTLLSLAGGPLTDADLGDVAIKRRAQNGEEILKYDVEHLLDKPGARSPTLEANDIVIVPRDKPTISNNTLTTVGFVGSILSVVLAAIVLSNQTSK
jgi:hypothetical protein